MSTEHSSTTPAIEIRNVSKRFGSVVALDGVSFSVKPGELFFLLGPSGCGKTTILRILAGLETPDSGTILLDGKDIAHLPPYRRGAPMVFQNYALWPHLSVSDNVAFGLVERRVAKADIRTRVAEVLKRVGLSGMGERMPGQLSGGQQQRVVLARALVLNPNIVLLDEPLSNLDAKLRSEMREEIETLHRQTGITFVYVTHDQVEALSLADRMAVLNQGRMCALGSPLNLYHRPPNMFCADFLGESNQFAGTVASSDGTRMTIDTPFGRWQAMYAGEASLPGRGDTLTCMVRPENLRLDGNGENRLEAQVVSLRLTGPTVTAVLDAGGRHFKATILSGAATQLKPGAKAAWCAEAGHTIALRPD